MEQPWAGIEPKPARNATTAIAPRVRGSWTQQYFRTRTLTQERLPWLPLSRNRSPGESNEGRRPGGNPVGAAWGVSPIAGADCGAKTANLEQSGWPMRKPDRHLDESHESDLDQVIDHVTSICGPLAAAPGSAGLPPMAVEEIFLEGTGALIIGHSGRSAAARALWREASSHPPFDADRSTVSCSPGCAPGPAVRSVRKAW